MLLLIAREQRLREEVSDLGEAPTGSRIPLRSAASAGGGLEVGEARRRRRMGSRGSKGSGCPGETQELSRHLGARIHGPIGLETDVRWCRSSQRIANCRSGRRGPGSVGNVHSGAPSVRVPGGVRCCPAALENAVAE
jgi:hypothetical protein